MSITYAQIQAIEYALNFAQDELNEKEPSEAKELDQKTIHNAVCALVDIRKTSREWVFWQNVGPLSRPVIDLFKNYLQYPTESNRTYLIGALWALKHANLIHEAQYKYFLAIAGHILDNPSYRESVKEWLA